MDLTGTILKDSVKIEINLNSPSNSKWPKLVQIGPLNKQQRLNIVRYDFNGNLHYMASKEGFLFESKNNKPRLVLNLNNDALFPFISDSFEVGLLGIASKKDLVYVSYTSQDINGLFSLVVDEYSKNFTKVRNIIKINWPLLKLDQERPSHFGGNLLFDKFGELYLSVGDGSAGIVAEDPNKAQDLNSLNGKIIRLDVSQSNLEPEIVAYGIRNPWGVTIDSNNRMFVLQCGHNSVEAVYLLSDLYSDTPANLGWPVFEGSKRIRQDPLIYKEVTAPIFEYSNRPGCATSGVYLDNEELFVLGDFYGTIRFLKEQENNKWSLLHKYKLDEGNIWSFSFNKKTQKILIAPENLDLEILVDEVDIN
jgi:hypothetical protein